MSTRLFYVVAGIAVIATIVGVLVLRGRSSGSDSKFGGQDDPVLDAKIRQLRFYDWETHVIGPGGRPSPGDPAVTGGPNAGRAGGLKLYDAVLRASRRPAVIRASNGRPVSEFFAVDRAHRRVGRAVTTRAKALAGAPAGSTVVEVRPGTAIVAADGSASRWYVIDDDVAIDGSQISEARQGTDQSTGRAVTLFAFDTTGVERFRQLTKAIAARGSQASLDNADKDPALFDQHFAVVYQGQLITVPAVNFRRSPEGLDAGAGTQLAEQLP